MNKALKTAFTLIELLVVIAIVGILSGLIVVSTSSMTQKANLAKAQMFSSSLRNALMANIIGEWKLDDTSGTAVSDTWAKVSNGTLVNFNYTTAGSGDTNTDGWMSSSNCISGTCLKFDGSNDYLNLGSNTILDVASTITIGVWIKTSEYAGCQDILEKNYYNWAIRKSWNGSIVGYPTFLLRLSGTVKELSSTAETGARIYDDNWHYIVATYDGTWMKLYIDGAENRSTNSYSGTITTGGTLYVGYTAATTGYYNGLLDELRVYSAAIPSSQVKEQYYAGINSLLASGQITKEEYLSRIQPIAEK
jgi:prepilin-type N-terminal cleavage/methylation domain-containing protein